MLEQRDDWQADRRYLCEGSIALIDTFGGGGRRTCRATRHPNGDGPYGSRGTSPLGGTSCRLVSPTVIDPHAEIHSIRFVHHRLVSNRLHRAHAQIENRIKNLKDTGLSRLRFL
ncbi:MAG: hypothetical protein KY462_15050 [Actinobacteria bacterium]|nr:hypothetical protein [Actinomycetota bacterium]